MSQKHYKNFNKVLDLSLVFLAMFFAIVLGVYLNNEIEQRINELETEIDSIKTSITEMEAELNKLEQDIICIQNLLDSMKQEETEEEPEQVLEGYQLYNFYADQIVSEFYPDLDSRYIKAIIYHESRYQPGIINTKTGVEGLMQISPKWHTQRAKNLGVEDLLDPYGNILVGCDILNELTQKHDFNYALNFFAGGYPYANRYKSSTSPFVEQLNQIIAGMEAGRIEN